MRSGGAVRLFSRLALAALSFCAATEVSAEIAPPVDVPIRYTIVEERSDAKTMARFAVDRILTFHRTPQGYDAELRQIRSTAPAVQGVGAMFAAGMRAIEGRSIRFHLDSDGTVLAVDDEDMLWESVCAGLEAMAQGQAKHSAPRKRFLNALAAPLRALPPARRRDMLASMIAPVIAVRLPTPGDGAVPVTVPARDLTGIAVDLPGTRRISRATDGTIMVETEAAGVTPANGSDDVRLTIASRSRIDPRSRLVTEAIESREILVGSGASTLASRYVTTTRLIFTVS